MQPLERWHFYQLFDCVHHSYREERAVTASCLPVVAGVTLPLPSLRVVVSLPHPFLVVIPQRSGAICDCPLGFPATATGSNNQFKSIPIRNHPSHHIPPPIHHIITIKFTPPRSRHSPTNLPRAPGKTPQNPKIHHNSPQTPNIHLFHSQLVQPNLLTHPVSA